MRTAVLAFFIFSFAVYWWSTTPTRAPALMETATSFDAPTWLQEHASADSNPEELKKIAASLKREDLLALKKAALDTQLTGEERFLAVYMIGHSAQVAALELLKEIGNTAVSKLKHDKVYPDEIAVRSFALDAVVQRLPPKESAQFLREILSRTSDPSLAKHARYWLARLG